MKKKVYGVGVNDAGYPVKKYKSSQTGEGKQKQTLVWFCPYYDKWKGMLRRCLSLEYKNKHPSYMNCTVCEGWLTFSNFKSWCINYERLYNVKVEGTDLDKDILIAGNLIYSPTTCCLIPNNINKFLTDNFANRGDLPLGVSYSKKKCGGITGLRARCKNPFTLKEVGCGSFSLEGTEEAHQAWKSQKHLFACQLAESGFTLDEKVNIALRNRYKDNNND